MFSPHWVYCETIQKRIRVIKVNRTERHIDAQNIDDGLPFCLDVETGLNLEKLKAAKVYSATIKVFTAKLEGELERHLTEMSIEDPQLRHSLQVIKQTGSTLKKLVLIKIK